MSNLDLSTPITTEKFDRLWIENLVVGGSPKGKVTAIVRLKPFNGTDTLDDTRTMQIPDVFALAATDSKFATVIGALMDEIGRQAKLRNLFE
jgi:hypothetical protein